MPYDRDLLAIFSGEQSEHINRLRTLMDGLPKATGEARENMLQEILRRAHTIKGAARAVGLEATEQLAHRIETLFAERSQLPEGLNREFAAAVHRALDTMEDILAAAQTGQEAEQTAPAPQSPDIPSPSPDTTGDQTAFLRVSGANVDSLIRASSQLVALFSGGPSEVRAAETAGRAGRVLDEFETLRRACVPFLRSHEDDVEAVPLRECLEFVSRELHSMAVETRISSRKQHQRTWELSRQIADVHENAIRVRMIPAESVFGAFGAMVRQIAQDDGKQVLFRTEGLEVQADRMVLQSLKDPVMHLLRNAVSHGIESPQERIAAGKPADGSVRLRFAAEGNRLVVSVEDDGRGLNAAAVRQRAIAAGLLPAADAREEQQNLDMLLFRSGFSTSEQVTKLSGRGLGLSVVKETADRLHGNVEVRNLQPSGLAITISVGLSVSTQQVLVMEAAGNTLAVPTQYVRHVTRARRSALRLMGGREVLTIGEENVPVARLAEVLGLTTPGSSAQIEEEKDPWIYVTALKSEGRTVGFIVDRLVDEREAVIKDLGLPERGEGISAGCIALEDGGVALLFTPAALMERCERSAVRPTRPAEAAEKTSKRRILIVDDSLTTRSLERSILEANGFQVTVAVDGVDALEKLAQNSFDLVITDVAMPRMDGMQLLEEMKKRRSTENIPVIMLTSMESREDQKKGMALGAEAYLIKRKFDQQELLRTVRQIL